MKRSSLAIVPALALMLPVGALMIAEQARAGQDALLPRPQGPCDIYIAAGYPCVAAGHGVQRLDLSRVTTLTPGSAQDVTVPFTNTTRAPAGVTRKDLTFGPVRPVPYAADGRFLSVRCPRTCASQWICIGARRLADGSTHTGSSGWRTMPISS